MSNVVAYSEAVSAIMEYYNVSSEYVWETINQYGLTPEQLADMVPSGPVLAGDGVYKILNNSGNITGYANSATINVGSENAVQSAINSNAQTGTAAVTEKVRFAGNSVIDQNGKVVTSPNVTKYTNGVAGTTKAVVGSVVSGIGAYAAGVSLGKKIDSALYNANPTFWDSLGLSTLDPSTWASITSDMSDTGTEGALKTAFNFLLGIDPNGNTQAYMDADAYKYVAYALAKTGMFDVGDTEIPSNAHVGNNTPCIGIVANGANYNWSVAASPLGQATVNWLLSGTTYIFCSALEGSGTNYDMEVCAASATAPPFSHSTYTYDNKTVHYFRLPLTTNNTYYKKIIFTLPANPGVSESSLRSKMQYTGWYMIYGELSRSSSLDGVTDQTGATTPTGISSLSTQQEVSDAIDQQYPDLNNNRIEQTVVQPDGTIITKIYYPVPMPNGTVDTTTTENKTVTIDQPIQVVLPNGATLTLPDGTTVTGDGVTPITLPPGTYVLPSGTVIKNNYVTNETDGDGGTQAETETTTSSTDLLLRTIINILTSSQPQNATDTETESDSPTDNPADTGDGNTPPVAVPTGSASALWSVYNPSLTEINSFGAWLWSSNFIDQLLKMFNDPMQAIIGLHKTYIPPVTGAQQNIHVGYLDSGVSSLTVPTQYSTVDCGSVQLSEYFGNVFDYDPYTKVYIYLPFIGFKELDVSQVMRSSIGVKYHGDAYTGACLAEISVTRDAGAGGVLYSFAGDCAVRYPLSQGSYMGIVNAIASLAVGAVSVATGAGGLGMVGALGMAQRARTSVEKSGSFDGNSGAMGIKKPYLVVMRPQTAMPSNYGHYSGHPSSAKVTIGSTSGLIRVRECHVDSIPYATKEEKAMIDNALHEGILV